MNRRLDPGLNPRLNPGLNEELAAIQTLLLKPDTAGMQEVERRLEKLVAALRESRRESRGEPADPAARIALGSVRFLLDSAKLFWDRRRPLPGLQYSADGALVESSSGSTFAVEF